MRISDWSSDVCSSYLESLGGFPAQRHAAAIAFAAVDVLACPAAFAQRVDEAGVARVIADRAHRQILAERQVDRTFQMAAEIVAVDEIHIALDLALDAVGGRLVGDVSQRAADRARAAHRALTTEESVVGKEWVSAG